MGGAIKAVLAIIGLLLLILGIFGVFAAFSFGVGNSLPPVGIILLIVVGSIPFLLGLTFLVWASNL